ncbi:MAG: beta strand repeat-containing protein, partial [Candidatus Omnitrophota bacterium]
VITAKGLTVTGITADNKVYDGNTTATLNAGSAALVGVVAGDTVTLGTGSAAGTFSDKNVAAGKTVQVSGLTVSGTDSSNYSLTQPTTTADITARTLTVTATGVDKEADGTIAATVTLSDDAVAGDTLTTSYSGANFVNASAGTGKTVNVTGISISGTDAANYNLASTTDATTADIYPAAAATFTITGGTTQTAGTANALTISTYDAYGNLVSFGPNNYAGDKSITFSGANASPNPATNPTASDKDSNDVDFGTGTTITFAAGVGNTNLKLYRAETAEIEATDGTVTSTGSAAYDLDVTVSPANKTKLVWVSEPGSTVTAGDIWTAFTIEITDLYGNRTSDIDNVTVAPSSGSFAGGTTTQAAVSGFATFDDLTYTAAGNITVTGSGTSLTSTPASGIVAVGPAALSYFTIGGISGPVTAGALSTPVVTAYDAYSNIKTDYTGSVQFSSSDLQAALPSDYTFINGDSGQRSFTDGVQLKTAGQQSVTVADGAISASQNNITVNPAAASDLAWVTQPDSSVTAGDVWTAFTIEIIDAYNNRTSDTNNITVAPSSGSFASGTTTQAAANGLATFNDITYNSAGTITVTGSASSLTSTPASNSITVDASSTTPTEPAPAPDLDDIDLDSATRVIFDMDGQIIDIGLVEGLNPEEVILIKTLLNEYSRMDETSTEYEAVDDAFKADKTTDWDITSRSFMYMMISEQKRIKDRPRYILG